MHYIKDEMSELGRVIFDILYTTYGSDNFDADLDSANWKDEKHIEILVHNETRKSYLAEIVRLTYRFAIIAEFIQLEYPKFKISFTAVDIPDNVRRRDLTVAQAYDSHYDYLKRRGTL